MVMDILGLEVKSQYNGWKTFITHILNYTGALIGFKIGNSQFLFVPHGQVHCLMYSMCAKASWQLAQSMWSNTIPWCHLVYFPNMVTEDLASGSFMEEFSLVSRLAPGNKQTKLQSQFSSSQELHLSSNRTCFYYNAMILWGTDSFFCVCNVGHMLGMRERETERRVVWNSLLCASYRLMMAGVSRCLFVFESIWRGNVSTSQLDSLTLFFFLFVFGLMCI